MELDVDKDHQHLVCSNCEAVWCFVCIERKDIKISKKWLEEQLKLAELRRIASLN